MASRRLNVLVYSGAGSSTASVRHCLYTLRRLLSPTYAVIPVSSEVILKEPWLGTCALLVMPGGADLGYCRTLNGEGNRRISRYVNGGGAYLGFCAGGYYGSQKCEFEVHDEKMRVVGERELAFFPGTCRGLAFEGFEYASEAGARAADVLIHHENLQNMDGAMTKDGSFKSYYNGGGVFFDAEGLQNRGVEILASYTEDLHVESGESKAAVVYRKIGEGHVVLTGPHPEFAPQNLPHIPTLPSFDSVISEVKSTDTNRVMFMRLLLRKLNLTVNDEEQTVPTLSSLHLTALNVSDVTDIVESWKELTTVVDGREYIKSDNDVFKVEEEGSTWSVQGMTRAVSAIGETVATIANSSIVSTIQTRSPRDGSAEQVPKSPEQYIQECIGYTSHSATDQLVDYDRIIKTIITHQKAYPSAKEVPFHHEAYYASLYECHKQLRNPSPSFGKSLLYGEVLTSTSSLLEKNNSLLRTLPSGTTVTATTQVAGRGRGTNVWVAPPGSLLFSTVIHHPMNLSQAAPIIFIQYIAALATIRGINTYAPGYDVLPVKFKWPNDIYARLPGSATNPFVKIVGILLNTSYTGDAYSVVCGIGINVSNAAPTTSLDQLAAAANPPLPAFSHEKLLANILAHFESLYTTFTQAGFTRDMEAEYYRAWLHTDQIVTLESEGGIRARIKGITRDWGLLLAEELGWQDRPTGRVVSLQSDSNSFDFFKGLVRRKL